MRYAIAIFILLQMALAGYQQLRVVHYKDALEAEQTAHEQTRKELEDAKVHAEALAENARLCLAREAQARQWAVERNDILGKAFLESRTPEEKEKVVDDETRNAVIKRLNRGLRF